MGRSAGEPINNAKVERALKQKGLLQKDLADLIGISREQLNRALRSGRISAQNLDRIGFCLDLMPEYLSDPKEWDGFMPNNYHYHLLQTKESQWGTIIRWIWLRHGYEPEYLDHGTLWSLFDTIEDAVNNKLKELNEKGLLENYRAKKIDSKNNELITATALADDLHNYAK